MHQLASAAGATVIATSSTDEKLETAKRLGAKHVINYRKNANWADEVLRITNGRGVDHVVEVGGAGTIEESLRSTRVGGLVSVMGILTESKQADLIPHILFGAKTSECRRRRQGTDTDADRSQGNSGGRKQGNQRPVPQVRGGASDPAGFGQGVRIRAGAGGIRPIGKAKRDWQDSDYGVSRQSVRRGRAGVGRPGGGGLSSH